MNIDIGKAWQEFKKLNGTSFGLLEGYMIRAGLTLNQCIQMEEFEFLKFPGFGRKMRWQIEEFAKFVGVEHGGSWMDGLSTRCKLCIHNMDLKSRDDVLQAYKSGRLKPEGKKHPRNYGWKSHREIAKWLGLPEPVKPKQAVLIKCPHCGADLQKPQ